MKLLATILLGWAVPACAGDLCGLLLSSAIPIRAQDLSNYGIVLGGDQLKPHTARSAASPEFVGRLRFYSDFAFWFLPAGEANEVLIFGPSGHFLMRMNQSALGQLDLESLTTWLTQVPLQNSRARGAVDQISILNNDQIVGSVRALDRYIFTMKWHDGISTVKTYGLNPQSGKPVVRLEDFDIGPDSIRATEVSKSLFGSRRQRLVFGETAPDPFAF